MAPGDFVTYIFLGLCSTVMKYFQPRIRRVRGGLLALLSLLIIALSSCSSRLPPPTPLTLLHAPNLVRLESFPRLEASTDNKYVDSLLAYSMGSATSDQTAPSNLHLLILQRGSLYDATFNAKPNDILAIRAAQGLLCYRLGTVDPQGAKVL